MLDNFAFLSFTIFAAAGILALAELIAMIVVKSVLAFRARRAPSPKENK